MKFFRNIMVLLIALIVFPGCTISHVYGPYNGKVVDKETGEPIEGAVVFIEFSVDGFGGASAYVDAVETLTDNDGTFNIPAQKIYFVRPLYETWEEFPIIFKPGYGAYPRHKEVETDFDPLGLLPTNKPATIKLPKLDTMKKRGRNSGDALSFDRSKVPYEKYKLLFEAVNEERRFIGSEPLPDPRQFKWSK